MTKKLIATLLAVMLLLPLGALGANALTPEEELEAQGWALAEETLAIFDTKKWTLKCDGEIYLRDGNRIAVEDRQWTNSFLLRLLLGEVEREIITPAQNLVLFNERGIYFDSTWILLLTGMAPGMAFETMSGYFGSAGLLKSMSVHVAEENAYLVVTLDDPGADGSPVIKYYYLDGQLKRISRTQVSLRSAFMPNSLEVESLAPGADLSQFSTKGMSKLPSLLFLLLSVFG